MTSKLTIGKLKNAKCMNPDCECDNELVFHSNCHPKSPTWTWWRADTEDLLIQCAECEETVTIIDLSE